MPSAIKAKNGSSLFEAALSSIKKIRVISTNRNRSKQYIVDLSEGQTAGGFSYVEIFLILIKSDFLHIYPDKDFPTRTASATTSASGLITIHLLGRVHQDLTLVDWSIETKSVDAIRALAKEIRSDRAVANAAKKPTKPKADLKSRRDVI